MAKNIKNRISSLLFQILDSTSQFNECVKGLLRALITLENQQNQLEESGLAMGAIKENDFGVLSQFDGLPSILLFQVTQNIEKIQENCVRLQNKLKGIVTQIQTLQAESLKILQQNPLDISVLAQRTELEPSISEMIQWIQVLAQNYEFKYYDKYDLLQKLNMQNLQNTRTIIEQFEDDTNLDMEYENEILEKMTLIKKYQEIIASQNQ